PEERRMASVAVYRQHGPERGDGAGAQPAGGAFGYARILSRQRGDRGPGCAGRATRGAICGATRRAIRVARSHAALRAVLCRRGPHSCGRAPGRRPGRRRVDGLRGQPTPPARDGTGGPQRLRDRTGTAGQRRRRLRVAPRAAGSRGRIGTDEHVAGARPGDAGVDDAVLSAMAGRARGARGPAPGATERTRHGQAAIRPRPSLLLGSVCARGPVEGACGLPCRPYVPARSALDWEKPGQQPITHFLESIRTFRKRRRLCGRPRGYPWASMISSTRYESAYLPAIVRRCCLLYGISNLF